MFNDEYFSILKRLQFLKENIFVLDSLIQRLYKKKIMNVLNQNEENFDDHSYIYYSSFYSNKSMQIKAYELKRESQKIKYINLRHKVQDIIDNFVLNFINIFQDIKSHHIPYDNLLDIKSFLYPFQNPKFLFENENLLKNID